MSEKQNSFECTIICWGIAAFVGVVSMVMLYMLAGFGANQAFFTGALIGFVLGIVLSLFICRGQTAAADLAADEKPAQRYARQAAEDKAQRAGVAGASAASAASASASAHSETASHTEAQPAATTSAAPASLMSSGVQPSKPLAGEAELASRKGEWKYGADGDGHAKPAAAKDAIPAGETAAPAVAPDTPADAGTKPKRAAVAADGKPELYDAPPADGADDLKQISGVGPKLEQTLNDMGIYRFEQVAGWRKKEIEWVDARLRFKGRIERDDWMSQAKILAKGGETEFSKRKKK